MTLFIALLQALLTLTGAVPSSGLEEVKAWNQMKWRPLQSVYGLRTGPDGRTVIFGDYGNGRVGIIDANGRARVLIGRVPSPHGIWVNGDGSVWTASHLEGGVRRFSRNGRLIMKVGSVGDAPGQFRGAVAVSADAEGNVYVADYLLDRVSKFGADGRYLLSWGGASPGEGLRLPHDVYVHGDRIYVADRGNKRVQVYDLSGRWLTSLQPAEGVMDPVGLHVSGTGDLLVVDYALDQIRRWTSAGEELPPLKADASKPLLRPTNVTVRSDGLLMVSEEVGKSVRAFAWKGPAA